MRFRELAWGSFLYRYSNRGTQGETKYNNMISDEKYLLRLLNNPSFDDFETIRDFLVHFGVRFAPKILPEQYLRVWPQLQPNVEYVHDQDLTTIDFSNSQIQAAIKNAFSLLQYPFTWGGDTVASKALHFFNTHLFVMWDEEMRIKYRIQRIEGYLNFLQEMQIQAQEVVADFKALGLPGTPSQFLTQQLEYSCIRPITKFIDQYNWIIITRGWPSVPPEWFLKLYLL